jgi:plastocyanin
MLLAAALGSAAAVVPAIASSEAGPTVSGLESIVWAPAQVTVAGGAAVSFQNTSGSVAHGVVWETGDPQAPACTGVPIDEGRTSWQGSCTFSKPGVYRYYCSVHGMAMSGEIVVNSPETTSTPTPAPTTPTGAAPPPPATGPAPPGATPSSPLAGSAADAVALARAQLGGTVRGSIDVSPAGAGARLEVDLLADAAALAEPGTRRRSGRSTRARIGSLTRTSLKPGEVSFAVALSRTGRAALRRRGRLALTVKITLAPVRGGTVHLRRTVLVRTAAARA